MIELEIKDYSKAVEALKKVQINNLFARAVVENHVSGKVYVDNPDNPTTFYVVHPYGMSLLSGKHDNQDFNKAFKYHALNKNKTQNAHVWMQAYPEQWNVELKTLFSNISIKSSENKTNQTTNIVELNTRVNFKFNHVKYTELKKKIKTTESSVIRTTEKEFKSMRGSVIPSDSSTLDRWAGRVTCKHLCSPSGRPAPCIPRYPAQPCSQTAHHRASFATDRWRPALDEVARVLSRCTAPRI